jgi:septum formation protein
MALAARKVARLLPTLSPVEIAIAADTIVVHKGEILGKPADLAQARAFLLRLSGDWHTVHTGVAVAHAQRCWLFYETTHVRFHPLDPALIDFYLQTSPPLDKAGAYGAQDLIGMTGIAEIVGDFYNVVGLPIQKLTQFWYRTLGELPNLSS